MVSRPGDEEVWLFCPGTCAHRLAADLERFHIRESLDIGVDSRRIAEVHGPQTAEVLHRVFGVAPSLDLGAVTVLGDGANFVADSWTGDVGGHLVLSTQTADGWMPVLREACPEIAPEVWEVLRIEGGRAHPEKDLRPNTLLQELDDAETMADFNKGCYLGQETVARVHSRGRVNKRFSGLKVEGDSPPRPGSLVMHQGNPVGEVTSSTWSPSLNSSVALGWLRRTHSEPGLVVHIDCGDVLVAARVRSLPLYQVPGPKEQAEVFYGEGLEAFKLDRFQQAMKLFEKAMLLNPGHRAAQEAVGVCHERMGDLDSARAVMEDLTLTDPENPMPWTNLSRYLAQAGDIEKAEEAKAQALHLSWKQRAGEAEALRRSRQEEEQRKVELEERVSLFEQVLELDPDDVVACFGLGKVYADLEQWEKAEPLFARAIKNKPDYSMAFSQRSRCLAKLGRAPEAVNVLKEGIEIARQQGDLMPKQEMERRLNSLTQS